MKFRSLLGAVLIATVFVACGDKGSDNGTNTTVPSTPLSAQYYQINKGLCYDDNNNRVDANNCEGLSGYYDVNGYCYNPSDVRVGNEFCQNNPSRVRPQCQGHDYYSRGRGGKPHQMDCGKRGCRGHNVYDRDGRGYYCRS